MQARCNRWLQLRVLDSKDPIPLAKITVIQARLLFNGAQSNSVCERDEFTDIINLQGKGRSTTRMITGI